MIVLYTSPGCASCRKAKAWLKERGIEFVEKNIFNTLLNKKEIKYLLTRTDNGTDDIISKRSKIIQENHIDLDKMSIDEIIDFIIQNPSILRRPIILNERNFQIGFDQEEIDAFERTKHELQNEIRCVAKCDKNCPNFPTCGALRGEENE